MNPFPFTWKRDGHPAAALMAGLVPAQIIATFQVYFSNRALYRTLAGISTAGHGAILHVWHPERLQELTTAFFGGLFFTLTAGAGISLISFGAAWIWDRVGSRRDLFLIPMLMLWAAFLISVNGNGFSPFTTLYFAIIPPVVFTLTVKWMPRGNRKRLRRRGLLHLIPIAVLGILWGFQMEKDLFTNIRDHLLLTNPLGERIVRFYYQYTPYPARVLKPLERKRVKAFNLKDIPGSTDQNRLRKTLIAHHWFEAKSVKTPDLFLYGSGGKVLLEDGRGKVLEIRENAFSSDPEAALKKFSSLVDRHRFFRQFTFYSLLIAFPITLYIFTCSLFLFFMGRWVSPGSASALSAILTYFLGVMLFIWFWHNSHPETTPKEIAPAVETRSPAKAK